MTRQHDYNRKSRIAFGSCNDQDLQNNLWPVIAAREPIAFIWGGDAIYADKHLPADWSKFPPSRELECATPERLKRLYRQQLADTGYQALLGQNVSIFGTFDDHDYGCNNADRTYPHKKESGLAFVDFLNEPTQSAMRRRAEAGLGVYGVKVFDFSKPVGHETLNETESCIDPDSCSDEIWSYVQTQPLYSNATVAVFVLDVRTHKTPWKQGPAAYALDWEGDFLGERQWKWFEIALRRSRASVNVIVNGLQVHANRFPNGNVAEAWGRFPSAQQRLFDAVLQDNVRAPIFVSGDVHMTQLMRKDCVRRGNVGRSPPLRSLVELTTSGMTHSWGTMPNPPKHGITHDFSWKVLYSSWYSRNLMHLLHAVSPWTDVMHTNTIPGDTDRQGGIRKEGEPSIKLFPSGGGEGASVGLQYSLQKNFGEIEINWAQGTVTLRALGEDPLLPPLLMAKVALDQLPSQDLRHSLPGSGLSYKDFERGFKDQAHANRAGEWICINHRGRDDAIQLAGAHILSGVVVTACVLIPLMLAHVIFKSFVRRGKQATPPVINSKWARKMKVAINW